MGFAKLLAAFRENQAHTHPEHPDPTLRGRTYAIPFRQVWAAAVDLASGGLRGWRTEMADEDLGILRAESQTILFRFVDDVEIRVSLDENAQTRVDLSSTSRTERGDLGQNARRIRRFFRVLDKRIGAGPGNILDPTLPLIRSNLLFIALLLMILQGGFAGCEPVGNSSSGADLAGEDTLSTTRNFRARSYERDIVFLTSLGDSTLLVPWSFSARTTAEGVDRELRGWLARSDTWDPFLLERWESPTTAVPWRVLPHGPLRLIVGLEDALETIVFQEGGRNVEVNIGELLVEWSGQRAQTYRVHKGTIVLSDRTVDGHILDMTRAWATDDAFPGDWGILLSGDSLQLVMEDLAPDPGPEGGSFSVWTRLDFQDRQWRGIRLVWSEIVAFEEARRDVPVSWEIQSPDGDLLGSLTTLAPFMEVEEGEGPLLPVNALFQVAGTLTLAGGEFPVRGFLRHVQR